MFMEQLEKALYNACEGTAVAMVTPQSPVRLFFRTNRATCQEWYNRIRVVLMTVARHAGQPAVVLRHASELITALRRDSASQASGDLETAVRYAVEALVQLQCPEAVTGFYQWYKDVTGRRLPWVKAMAEMAAGRYESAVTDLQAAMRSVISGESNAQEEMGSGGKEKTPLPPGPQSAPGSVKVMSRQAAAPSTASKLSHDGATLHLIVNQVTEAYLRLHSWQEVVEWEANVYKLRSEVTDLGLQKALYFDVDMNQFR
jgi:PI-3-kinase-related kinase SMG-1